MKYYTGIGSRETPNDIAQVVREIAFKLAQEGWTLRSGGAGGADTFFEEGCDDAGGEKEIYIPWNGFSNRQKGEQGIYLLSDGAFRHACSVVEQIHPAPAKLTRGAYALHARNCYQVAGLHLHKKSQMLVCWAKTDKNGDPVGGTRTAWMYAKELGIKSFNLYNDAHFKRIKDWLNV